MTSVSPGIVFAISRICSPFSRSTARSGPKTFTAIFADTPLSMWLKRCPMGWPMFKNVPGILPSFARISANTSSRGLPPS